MSTTAETIHKQIRDGGNGHITAAAAAEGVRWELKCAPAAAAIAFIESVTAAMRLYRSCVVQEQQHVQDRILPCEGVACEVSQHGRCRKLRCLVTAFDMWIVPVEGSCRSLCSMLAWH
jgi:hypothetical protein